MIAFVLAITLAVERPGTAPQQLEPPIAALAKARRKSTRPGRRTRRRAALSEARGDFASYYPNCAAARAAGAAPIRAGEPGYSRKLDRDGDGVACE